MRMAKRHCCVFGDVAKVILLKIMLVKKVINVEVYAINFNE